MIITTKKELHSAKIDNYESIVAVYIMRYKLYKEDFDIIINFVNLEFLEICVDNDKVIENFFTVIAKFTSLQTFIYHNYTKRWYESIIPSYFLFETNLIIHDWTICNCCAFDNKCESCKIKLILNSNSNIKNIIVHIANNYSYLLNNLPINLERLQISISNDETLFNNLPTNLKNLDILIGYGFKGSIKKIISNIKIPFNCKVKIFHRFQINMDCRKEKEIFVNTQLLHENLF